VLDVGAGTGRVAIDLAARGIDVTALDLEPALLRALGERARARGLDVSHIHIRHIWPMPKNMSVLLNGFEHILVPEMNMGQLKTLLRDQYLVDAKPLSKVAGQPFRIAEIEAAIDDLLRAGAGAHA
jgi:pyruvate/2-oxoacid:ferredoxin oxidoreductase alpha subunit